MSGLAGWYKNFNTNSKFLLFLEYRLTIFFSEKADIFWVFWSDYCVCVCVCVTSNLAWDENFWAYRNKENFFRKKTHVCGFIKTLKKDTTQVYNVTGVPHAFPTARATHGPLGLVYCVSKSSHSMLAELGSVTWEYLPVDVGRLALSLVCTSDSAQTSARTFYSTSEQNKRSKLGITY